MTGRSHHDWSDERTVALYSIDCEAQHHADCYISRLLSSFVTGVQPSRHERGLTDENAISEHAFVFLASSYCCQGRVVIGYRCAMRGVCGAT